jgi:16S rRNA processing protein RimM
LTDIGFDPESLVVGVVGRPHGVRGEITLRAFNERGDSLLDARSLIVELSGMRSVHPVEHVRPTPQGLLVKLVGIDDRDEAATLTGALVRLPRASLPPLGPDEFYVEDVVGCQVVRDDGVGLGMAIGTFWNGAHDVMTVVDGGEARERLIPLVADFVLSVDAPGRKIVVRWEDDGAHPHE